MGSYLNKTYAAIDGVLLNYKGQDISLKLPEQLAGMEIHTIGDGAVMESADLQQAVVPDGVRRIGKNSFRGCNQLMNVYLPYSVSSFAENAFQDCPKLKNLYIYGMELNEQRYRDLIASSSLVNGSIYLSHSFPNFKRVREAVSSTDADPANDIQSGIKRLFSSQSLEEEIGAVSLQRNLDGFSFESEDRYTTETMEFLRLIADRNVHEVDAISEEKNDEFMRSEKFPPIEKTAVFTFDDSKTKLENGKYIIFAEIKIGYHFWQSKVPVNLFGDTYYIYRRHYLSSVPNLNYVRREVAVFSENDLVIDRVKAKEIYAIYKLLSIL